MKEKYIKPETFAFRLEMQEVMQNTSSLDKNSNIVDDTQALSNETGTNGFSLWSDEEEE